MRFDWFPSLRKFWSLLLLWWVSRVRLNKNKNLNDFNDFQKVVSSSNLKTMLRLDKRSIWLELEFVLLLKYWHYYDIMIFDIAEMQCQCQYFNNNVSIVVELFTLLHSMLRCNASVNISTTMPVLLLKYLHYYIRCWEAMPVSIFQQQCKSCCWNIYIITFNAEKQCQWPITGWFAGSIAWKARLECFWMGHLKMSFYYPTSHGRAVG